MTQHYGVGMGLVVKLHALPRLVVPGLHMPLVYAVMFHKCLTPKFITIRSYMQQK
jgi:hypothetical protein